jgi:heptosyltransferase-1
MRVLIIRLSAIGDVVMTSALLRALRSRHPDALITWLTGPLGAQVLAHHPLIDELIVLPPALDRRAASDWWASLSALRRHRFDLLLDCQGLLKSALLSRLARARRRVVLNPREGSAALFGERVRDTAGHGGPVCREYRTLARHLALPEAACRMSLAASADARRRAAARFPPSTRPLVMLFPFTTRPQKHWPDAHWRRLGLALATHADARIVILGGPANLAGAQALAGAVPGAEVIAGRASDLDEKMACIERADLCVGVDTGLTHMALAFERPTLALFGSTCPYDDLGPLPGEVFYDALPCAPCRRHPVCDGRFDCLRDIGPQRVLAAALRFVARRPGSADDAGPTTVRGAGAPDPKGPDVTPP